MIEQILNRLDQAIKNLDKTSYSPIFYITDKFKKGEVQIVEEYLSVHPGVLSEYEVEIASLKEKYGLFGPKTL